MSASILRPHRRAPLASLAVLGALAIQPLAAHAEPPSLTGRWITTVERFGLPNHFVFHLTQTGNQLGGDFDGDPLTGTLTGATVTFTGKDPRGGYEDIRATLTGNTLKGTMRIAFSSDPAHPEQYAFTATRVLERRGPARKHTFAPTTYYRAFSALTKPVLTISAGDTISTTTVDAGGFDAKNIARVAGGNPQTGPFYIEGAAPGDTLVVHIDRLALNRDSAISTDAIAPRAKDGRLAIDMQGTGKVVRWHLDRKRNIATTESPGAHLANYTVPLRPMLGCVGVAPHPAGGAPNSGDNGAWGGNMDYNDVVEGSTVYLPVSNPGALLYIGDGHAAQGDGELTGDALETSMDVQITVDVIPAKRPPGPRVETKTHLAAIGLGGSLDDAFKAATSNMTAWLVERYQLTPSELAQVLGTAAEYRVTEVPDRNAGIALRLLKERLDTITTKP